MDASLAVEAPGLILLAGPNGSGKSTFAELVSGYLRPWSGKVHIAGVNAHEARTRARRRVCRAEPSHFPLLTVHDHIALASTARRVDRETGLRRATTLGLTPWLNENAGNLSTGTAKKLWYVINTLGSFDLAVFDEPFNGVDAQSVAVMAEEMTEWSQSACIVLITHALQPGLKPDRVIQISEFTPQKSN
ncbi:ABC transporter ATP-binding protein [Sinomonas humi]|uniref:ABC transporter ATP-binding protein n=1 Tax=Sinomonas humi TaxID=1338436 RepID=UPI0018CD8CFF|nr:ATP-binding cassette domain-containing protein [Sinomonas humi]